MTYDDILIRLWKLNNEQLVKVVREMCRDLITDRQSMDNLHKALLTLYYRGSGKVRARNYCIIIQQVESIIKRADCYGIRV